MIKNTLTDAGRIGDGFTDEKLDCAVRATACAMAIPYWQSHAVFSHFGRKPRHKTYGIHKILEHLDIHCVLVNYWERTSLKVFISNHSKGHFIVFSRGHAFAVIEGIVFDKTPLSGKYQVVGYAEIPEKMK